MPPRKPDSFRRSRTLKRRAVETRPLVFEDFPYVWAAYMKGAFDNTDFFKPGLNAPEFEAGFAGVIEDFLNSTSVPPSEIRTISMTEPVGIVTITYAGHIATPHCYWFPWASARTRLEAGVGFFIQLKANFMVMVTVKVEADVKFFRHLCKYGLLRTVGKIDNFFQDGKSAMLFQSVGS